MDCLVLLLLHVRQTFCRATFIYRQYARSEQMQIHPVPISNILTACEEVNCILAGQTTEITVVNTGFSLTKTPSSSNHLLIEVNRHIPAEFRGRRIKPQREQFNRPVSKRQIINRHKATLSCMLLYLWLHPTTTPFLELPGDQLHKPNSFYGCGL